MGYHLEEHMVTLSVDFAQKRKEDEGKNSGQR